MKKLTIILILLFSSMTLWAENILVITNVANPVNQITKNQLQDYFFKRNRVWPHGEPVRFFDRSDNSTIRNIFLREFVQKSSRQVDQFWIGQKFNTGDSAPTQVSSDYLSMSLVSRFAGGICYVLEGTPLSKDVKIINITGQ